MSQLSILHGLGLYKLNASSKQVICNVFSWRFFLAQLIKFDKICPQMFLWMAGLTVTHCSGKKLFDNKLSFPEALLKFAAEIT